jgi:hypothetical protein
VKQLATSARISPAASVSLTCTPRIAAPHTNEITATTNPVRTVGTARPEYRVSRFAGDASSTSSVWNLRSPPIA